MFKHINETHSITLINLLIFPIFSYEIIRLFRYGMVENAGTGYGYRIRIPDTDTGYGYRKRIPETDTGYRIRIPDTDTGYGYRYGYRIPITDTDTGILNFEN